MMYLVYILAADKYSFCPSKFPRSINHVLDNLLVYTISGIKETLKNKLINMHMCVILINNIPIPDLHQ